MRQFISEQSKADLTAHAGLALIGRALDRQTNLAAEAAAVSSLRADATPHRDSLACYVALLCMSKNNAEAITAYRQDEFFHEALGIQSVPSEATLRQRLDQHAEDFRALIDRASECFLARQATPITPLRNGLVPIDCDVSCFDNGRTQKEGVSRTYRGYDGYAPMMAYLGCEGWCLSIELREGQQHCQKDTPDFLARVLARARRLCPSENLLLRLDSGNDAIDNIAAVEDENDRQELDGPWVYYLIKWNPRRESPERWLAYADAKENAEDVDWKTPRPGKRVALFRVIETTRHGGFEYERTRVMRVTERTIDARGQHLLVPSIELEGWWTNLPYDEQTIIDLYCDHGTSEQFHSEFKTGLDLERLPSGKFATNALILACAQLAYNLLRWLGQQGLIGKDAPVRHPAKRRRLRTVMQELIYLAARLVRTGRRLKLVLKQPLPRCGGVPAALRTACRALNTG